jgi:glycosyltransferase involved in cell wall biosynthesis
MGGAEVLAARLARQLRERYCFVFVCLDEMGPLGEQLREEGFPVHVLGRRPGFDWQAGLRLARCLHRERADLLHAHQYTPFFYSSLARLLYRRPGILFTEHGRHHPDYPRRKRMLVNRWLLKHRDRVVGVGEAVRQALIGNEGIPPERVGVIYNGIDTTAFANGVTDRWAVRKELGAQEHSLVILQVARLDYLKDHATAVRTLERVLRQRPDALLVLVGEGPEYAKVRELVRQRGLESSVRFLGLRNDVARLLRAADLFLLTSISEGIPLTLIEAMAAGLPVVTTRVGGVPEVVEEALTGCLTPAGDDALLAEKILHLAADRSLRLHMGRRGCERARALFSESHMHAQYHQLYQEMLHG